LLFISIAAYLRIIPNEIKQFPHYDTLLHFILLGFASYFAHRAINRKYIWKYIPLGPVIILLLAIAEESSQMFSDIRCFCFSDLLANVSGIIIFYLFDLVFFKRTQKKLK
jgi:glycopeptide antibiotics resistance protein